MSIDGLEPAAYLRPDELGLAVPTLRRLRAEGAYSEGVRGVFPTMTYPSHASIATGVSPARHGIHGNLAFDPLGRNQDGWQWYAQDLRVPALWDLVAPSAVIGWPVTVGARGAIVVPDFWRAKNEEDRKLLAALSTPGLFSELAARDPEFMDRFHPPKDDAAYTQIAAHVLLTRRPRLLMLHLLEVDSHQHTEGVGSAPARAAIDASDGHVARLIAAARAAGIWEHTALVVVSDHGFAASRYRLNPGVALARHGLVTLDKGKPTDWRAALHINGGTGYVYLRDPADRAAAAAVAAALAEVRAAVPELVRAVHDHDAIAARGGDPRASFAIEGELGVGIGPDYIGELVTPATVAASHGWGPDQPAMRASLLIVGPGVAPGPIRDAALVDIAPTVAALLGVALPATDGRALPILRAPAP